MSDELKDFRYYADKAEAWLETTWKESPGNDIGHSIDKATVYAKLAKAAPKAEPALPCNVGLHGYRDGHYDGNVYSCIFAKGHAGQHQTDKGVAFRGLDNGDFPGPKDNGHCLKRFYDHAKSEAYSCYKAYNHAGLHEAMSGFNWNEEDD